MNIGMICHPTYGGSGVIATELGLQMANRGHKVHFISYDRPARLTSYTKNIFFHEVEIPNYPLFKYPPVTLSISSKIAEVCENENINILHSHYALPHSICAFLAKQILRKEIKIITTLHGTDISIVGQDKSFLDIVKFAIETSDKVTCVSNYLKELTYDEFTPNKKIKVIHNFINHKTFTPLNQSEKTLFNNSDEKIIIHLSNFRPYKNVERVIDVFELIDKKLKSRLVLIGEGPETAKIRRIVKNKELTNKVDFIGNQTYVESILPHADLFIFPSKEESFGVALLEAMSCGLCFIASKTGGIPELAGDELSDCLFNCDDVNGMAKMAIKLLKNDKLYKEYSQKARQRVVKKFNMDNITEAYLNCYLNID